MREKRESAAACCFFGVGDGRRRGEEVEREVTGWVCCRKLWRFRRVVRREWRGEKKVCRWTLFFRRCSDWWLWRFPVEEFDRRRGKARSEGKREREGSVAVVEGEGKIEN
ncbi:hypothetical protein HAX54_049148, partial [Datura stramonium]|nr:hypothetical protein [Datura stramonium]